MAITTRQAAIINAMENEAVRFRSLSDSLKATTRQQGVVMIKLESVLKLLQEENAERENLQRNCDRVLADFDKHLKKVERKLNRAETWRNVFVATTAAALAVIVLIAN